MTREKEKEHVIVSNYSDALLISHSVSLADRVKAVSIEIITKRIASNQPRIPRPVNHPGKQTTLVIKIYSVICQSQLGNKYTEVMNRINRHSQQEWFVSADVGNNR